MKDRFAIRQARTIPAERRLVDCDGCDCGVEIVVVLTVPRYEYSAHPEPSMAYCRKCLEKGLEKIKDLK